MQLDESYCCASCGKVSGILGSWKKQLIIAKDARRVDVLCYRIFLSFRLLDETSRFNELHEFVRAVKSNLETEVGPIDGVSAKMARDIVSRLPVVAEVQKLCSLAVKKADELMASKSTATINFTEGSLPAACKFLFENVTSSSVVVILIELSAALNNDIKGYKLWYCKTREESYSKDLVSNLSACHSVVSWCHPRAPNLDILTCFKDSHIWAIEHPTYSALTRPLCELLSLVPPQLLATHKKLRVYSMVAHLLQPHLVSAGTNMGVLVCEFDAKSLPPVVPLPPTPGSQEHAAVYVVERELKLLQF